MIKVGDRVKVVSDCDGFADRKRIGEVGEVVDMCVNGSTGTSPEDPLFVVQFSRGRRRRNGFWSEELELVT